MYDAAWDYYNKHNGDAEARKALAFMYGFLTHATGDMWGHTLVNDFANGIFPSIDEITNNIGTLGYATRHIIVESYIGEHTPDTNLAINSPNDFIYRSLIDADFIDSNGKSTRELGRGQIFDYFYNLRDSTRPKFD